MAKKRHKWTTDAKSGVQQCANCSLWRRRPMSAIRRGRQSVSDWDYLVDGEWQRKYIVPACEVNR